MQSLGTQRGAVGIVATRQTGGVVSITGNIGVREARREDVDKVEAGGDDDDGVEKQHRPPQRDEPRPRVDLRARRARARVCVCVRVCACVRARLRKMQRKGWCWVTIATGMENVWV